MYGSSSELAAWTQGFTTSGPDSPAAMERAKKVILVLGGGLSFVLIILWPCLALPAKVFSLGCAPLLQLAAACSHASLLLCTASSASQPGDSSAGQAASVLCQLY